MGICTKWATHCSRVREPTWFATSVQLSRYLHHALLIVTANLIPHSRLAEKTRFDPRAPTAASVRSSSAVALSAAYGAEPRPSGGRGEVTVRCLRAT